MPVGIPNIKKLVPATQPTLTAQTLYTAPANTGNQTTGFATAIIKEIWLVNTTSAEATITIGINGVGAVNQIVPAQTIAPNTVVPLSQINKLLNAGDTIQALQGTLSAITIHIDGVEVQ